MSLLLQPLFMLEFNEYFSNQFVEYFNSIPDTYSIIIYKTEDSNEDNWGVELVYNYFFDQLDEDVFKLP